MQVSASNGDAEYRMFASSDPPIGRRQIVTLPAGWSLWEGDANVADPVYTQLGAGQLDEFVDTHCAWCKRNGRRVLSHVMAVRRQIDSAPDIVGIRQHMLTCFDRQRSKPRSAQLYRATPKFWTLHLSGKLEW